MLGERGAQRVGRHAAVLVDGHGDDVDVHDARGVLHRRVRLGAADEGPPVGAVAASRA